MVVSMAGGSGEGVLAISGIVFFLASGLSSCLLVWDNVEPLAAVADIRAEDRIGAVVFFLTSGSSLCLLVWDNVEVVPTVLADGVDGVVFFLTSGFSLCFSVWDNVEPLAAAADVPTALSKRTIFSANAAVSRGVGGNRPKRA
jgi:hypothetical protein